MSIVYLLSGRASGLHLFIFFTYWPTQIKYISIDWWHHCYHNIPIPGYKRPFAYVSVQDRRRIGGGHCCPSEPDNIQRQQLQEVRWDGTKWADVIFYAIHWDAIRYRCYFTRHVPYKSKCIDECSALILILHRRGLRCILYYFIAAHYTALLYIVTMNWLCFVMCLKVDGRGWGRSHRQYPWRHTHRQAASRLIFGPCQFPHRSR